MHISSLKSVQCASMCSNNPNCEVWSYDSVQCEEGVASNLVGTTPNSPNAKAASIDQDLYRNNKGKINNVLRVLLSANTLFQLMEYGCGEDGQHALPRAERVLVPEQQHHAMGHSMQG